MGRETGSPPPRLRALHPNRRGPDGAHRPPTAHLHKVVDGLQVRQVVVVDVHADAEVEASIASVNDLEVPELRGREVGGQRQGVPRTPRTGQDGTNMCSPAFHTWFQRPCSVV